ncbi:Uncharacterised protein [Serratia fonticola]|uniref:Uncharacterized protein n=1 Tax=Serratia fonticola TaxID=47917 RepID=A0A448TC84_SERFO|nr:Uncharacterised protein [Serratia fonticola]
MACHFIRWDAVAERLDTHRLPEDLIERTARFSVKRRRRFLQGRILLAEMIFYLYGIPVLPPLLRHRPGARALPITIYLTSASPMLAIP